MINDILNKLQTIAPMGDEFEQFTAIMTIPDEQFDLIYGEMKSRMETIFTSSQFYEEMINNLAVTPLDNIDEEKKVVQDFIEEIKAEDTLSENKKDFLITLIERAVLVTFELIDVPRERVTVKIERINSDAKIPEYAHKTDAGADVFSAEEVTILAGETKIVKTGIKVAIPVGYEIQVRPRSGLSAKTGLRVANAPGTIDSDYRGEIGIILTNIGTNAVETIHIGDKIAQLVIAPTPMIKWEEGPVDDVTERGDGGFGSTDKKED